MIDSIRYYWFKSLIADLPNHFLRTELLTLRSNFM